MKSKLSALWSFISKKKNAVQTFEFTLEEQHVTVIKRRFLFQATDKEEARNIFWLYWAMQHVCGKAFTYFVEEKSDEHEQQYLVNGNSYGFLDDKETGIISRFISNGKTSPADNEIITKTVLQICKSNNIGKHE